jgi:hypothetical protein
MRMLRIYRYIGVLSIRILNQLLLLFAFFSQVYASTSLLLSLGNHKLLRYGGLQ